MTKVRSSRRVNDVEIKFEDLSRAHLERALDEDLADERPTIAAELLLQKSLESDDCVESLIHSFVHGTHATLAELPYDSITLL